MKKIVLKFSSIIGLLIYALYWIGNYFIKINDAIATPLCIVSISFMMIGIAYNGWCFGKGKNPYN